MKPFNYEEYLAGKPVITRDGREVTQIAQFQGENIKFPICALISGRDRADGFTARGAWRMSEDDHPLDLFMAPTTREVWVNLFDTHCAAYYESQDAADASPTWGTEKYTRIGGKAHKIVIEE